MFVLRADVLRLNVPDKSSGKTAHSITNEQSQICVILSVGECVFAFSLSWIQFFSFCMDVAKACSPCGV